MFAFRGALDVLGPLLMFPVVYWPPSFRRYPGIILFLIALQDVPCFVFSALLCYVLCLLLWRFVVLVVFSMGPFYVAE